MPYFHQITVGRSLIRGHDTQGDGLFNTPRTHGHHHGLDIIAKPGHQILSPIDGVIDRTAFAHDTTPDRQLGGLHMLGTGAWQGYEVWMFYVRPYALGPIRGGAAIGVAQDLSAYAKYEGIMNHVHIQVKVDGRFLNPMQLFGWFI